MQADVEIVLEHSDSTSGVRSQSGAGHNCSPSTPQIVCDDLQRIGTTELRNSNSKPMKIMFRGSAPWVYSVRPSRTDGDFPTSIGVENAEHVALVLLQFIYRLTFGVVRPMPGGPFGFELG